MALYKQFASFDKGHDRGEEPQKQNQHSPINEQFYNESEVIDLPDFYEFDGGIENLSI